MQILETAENYLEYIYMNNQENRRVRSIDLSSRLGVSKPTVSVMIKRLRENGYVVVEESGSLVLTDIGREIAERVYERHLVISDLLEAIGVDRQTAHQDACKIEHDLSDTTFAAIKCFTQQLKNHRE